MKLIVTQYFQENKQNSNKIFVKMKKLWVHEVPLPLAYIWQFLRNGNKEKASVISSFIPSKT